MSILRLLISSRTSTILQITALVLMVANAAYSCAAEDDLLLFASPADAEDFELQGEYAGRMLLRGTEQDIGFQVVAMGSRQFKVVGYPGGLPGEGWNGGETLATDFFGVQGKLILMEGGAAIIRDLGIDLLDDDGIRVGRVKKVHRKSPTLGMPPPPHAVVLFDGSNADAFENAHVTPDGLLMPGVMSRERFQDFRLHLEFRTPFMPAARGQGRGNSGVYLQGRYEVQILDSFGLEGQDNECGGVYGVKRPDVNMAFPPNAWQTYDIDFQAPRFDDVGRKLSDARLTVRHNGVLIQKDASVPGPTRASKVSEGPEPGPLYLQDHGNPVRFRNIWIVKAPADTTGTDESARPAVP